jgi:hypothetical protein
MGKFVHIEQDPDSRLDTNYGNWVNAINTVFPTVTQCGALMLEKTAFRNTGLNLDFWYKTPESKFISLVLSSILE